MRRVRESRIRGGHSFVQIRISDHEIFSPRYEIALLVALDRQTVMLHQNKIPAGGVILSGESFDDAEKPITPAEFDKLAEEAGGKITANTVAAGSCLALLGAPIEFLKDILASRFAVTESGVSPRALPCRGKAIVTSSGNCIVP